MTQSVPSQEALTQPVTLTHTNNYDFLRLMLATFVLISHSYPLVGLPEEDVLWRWSHGQTSLSTLAVYGFFTLSGLLITKSLLSSSSLVDYFYKRALRIMPAFWVVIVLGAVLCFFVSNKSASAYFLDGSVIKYVLSNAVLRLTYEIDGVFKNQATPVINGSIWTTPYTLLWYIFLSFAFLIRKHTTLLRALFCVAFVALFVLLVIKLPSMKGLPGPTTFGFSLSLIAEWGIFFIGGCIWALLPLPSERMRNIIGWTAFALFVLIISHESTRWIQYILLPLILVPLGSLRYPIISNLREIGDFSYGTYLYGWLVQQFIVHFFHPSYMQLVLTCIPITWLLGYFSWKLIEEKVLRLKLKMASISRTVAN